ncbi:hypothetical protein [Pedobacter sp. SL55]|uniref:hypothetical protein n=1 Tax=Pedobacter sp. SL55 TaxID=2995161 RepID=UPI0022719273|nr:hypothetical protein [Pedobacter sp. SL55]WAC41744.1 hypothetical protein OVA16_05110 [Pedobacter sp. SL55]
MYEERNKTINTYFSGFENDYKLLNRFDDKKMKLLLYIKENNKWQWKFIKLILKINSSLINKKSKT